MNFDFTLNKYNHFCSVLKNLSCPIITVKEYIDRNQPNEFVVVLRHDVDRKLSAAVKMACIEAEKGIRASYYVRMIRNTFKPSGLKKIDSLGHEIGYHYEVLAKAKGNKKKAINIFKTELNALRKIIPISTICMHGSPLSKWYNSDIWNFYDFKNYDVKCELNLSINYSYIYYFTDTGRNWQLNRYNLRDRTISKKPLEPVKTTDQLIGFLNKKYPSPVLINIHPNRWTISLFDFLTSVMMDWMANQIKWMISLIRN